MSGLLVITAFRFFRLTLRLYSWTFRRTIVMSEVQEGSADPEPLARFALASGSLPECIELGVPELSDRNAVAGMLRLAELRFAFLWEACMADVESGSRASIVLLLLSVSVVGFNGIHTYLWYCEGRNVSIPWCVFQVGNHLIWSFALGVAVSAIVYIVATLFHRVLKRRKAAWDYFSSKVKEDSYRQTPT
jgi:hypothetical protein